ncbi:hypothetical protein [Staphylococcus xylosus]|uniref:hypothetical protein n=1 Tax=Staphylococcus xylosus TaxID=1288 RepID=UPI001F205A21|nr:hypothetical protein [Staphylococcus xylosus]MCE7784388.1 hypothetical protein [Staphylococcus xylosus]
MKKLLLGLVLSFALILGACGNDEAEKKDDNKKSESVEKKKEAPKKEAKETEESKEDAEPATAIIPAHQEEERDSEGLTQKDRDRIATEQAKEYGENNPEGEQSNEGKMGPGPDDPNYKPDPKFTEGAEGYNPEEGDKMPTAGDYSFKQQVENPARDQVINEGIDMDNPTDAEIERMRELSKDSPHGLQSEPSQGGY